MGAFAAAIDRIFTDPNLALDAEWRPGGAAPGTSIRAIRKAPDHLSSFGDARVWSETVQVDVRAADVPDPKPGDHIVIQGEVFELQGEPTRDRERLVWTLDLRPE